jgi:light-regulated signal transduction histidine kinase (bacteriophytochrome)
MLQEQHARVLDEGGRRLLNIITANSKKMGEMIDGFLELMRLGRAGLRLDVVDMAALVREAIETLRAAYPGNRAKIEAGSLPLAIGDAVLLRQIWANLIENAFKFSAGRAEPIITVSGSETDTETVYSVQDNGAGFDARYANKLFGVFQRLHREGEFSGHGIGLANVHRIVTLHGGRAWAEGVPDKGATFHFSLPLQPLSGPPQP